jgi:uncharacterized membrane protein YphA (DoxX/SURF4 family)
LWAALTIVVELVGPIRIISGRLVWLGAAAIGMLTAVAAYVANDFWNLQGHERFMALNSFFEHWGLIAGCVLAPLLVEHSRREDRRSRARNGTAPR